MRQFGAPDRLLASPVPGWRQSHKYHRENYLGIASNSLEKACIAKCRIRACGDLQNASMCKSYFGILRSRCLCSRHSFLEPLGYKLPIHHVPPRADVVRTSVLVLQVVGMLPYIKAKERDFALRDRSVLVCR